MLALGFDCVRVMLVDEATGEVKWAVQAHSRGNWRARVAMSPGGRFVASVGLADEHWTLWDVVSGAVHRVGATHDGTGACICEVPTLAHRLLQEGCPVVAHTKGIRAVTFSPCGQRLATGGLDGALVVWNAQTWEAEHRMLGCSREIWSLSFSANGARLASGSLDWSIRVWDAPTGALLRTIQESHRFFIHVRFSPTDSSRVVSVGGGGDGPIHLWDVDSGERIRMIEGNEFAEISPDGRSIATAGAIDSRHLDLVDAESGALRFRMIAHMREVISASFSVDGSKLASVSYDGTVKVWDSSNGALLRSINVGRRPLSVDWGGDWVRDAKCAFAMGQHPRLGVGSQVLELEVGVVRMILDRV